jgi:hypothetical protein
VDATPASYTWMVNVDTAAPDTSISASPANPSTTTSASFSFTSTETPSTFQCSLDGAAYAACTSPQAYTGLAQGSHTFQVRATDAAGNTDTTPASYTWTVDSLAPDTTIGSTPANPSTSTSASFSFSSSETPSTFQCSLDGAAFAACTSPQSYTGLSNASHTFQVRATDAAGNVDATPASYTWTVNVDTTPPDTSINAQPANPTSNANPSFGFTSTETGSSFECRLDGAAFAGCTSPQAYTGLADGSHTFDVRATDAAGNADPTPASYTWTIDTSAPDTSLLSTPTNPTTSTSATFTFNSSETPIAHECRLDGAAFATCTSPQNYSTLATGSHTFDVRAVDAAGNVDPTPASYTWTIDSGSTPPTASSVTPATGSTDVANNVKPTITFAQAMDATTITRTSFTLAPTAGGAALLATVSYNAATLTATMTTSYPLAYSTSYTAKADTTIKDSTGQPLAAPITWSFTTTGTATPKRVNTGGAAFNATFGSFMADTPVTGVLTISGGLTRSTTNNITGTTDPGLYKDERYGVFTENIMVPTGTYDVKIHYAETQGAAAGQRVASTDITDTTGTDIPNLDIAATVGQNKALVKTITGVYVSDGALNVKTIAGTGDPVISAIEVLPATPAVTSTTPAANATGVSKTGAVKAVFSRVMDASSITNGTFTLSPTSGGPAVTATVTYDPATKTATLTPASALAPTTNYTATVAGSVRNSDGMTMGTPFTWSFTTKA